MNSNDHDSPAESRASGVLNLTHLRTLVAVVQEGHLTRAAERLRISQPAASHHLRSLEQQFGLPLFTRTPQGVVPTAAGLQLSEQAARLLASSLELLSTASELRGSASGRIAIGTIEDPSVHAALPSLIKWFHEHYPLIELSIESRNSSSIRQGILTGKSTRAFTFHARMKPTCASTKSDSANWWWWPPKLARTCRHGNLAGTRQAAVGHDHDGQRALRDHCSTVSVPQHHHSSRA